MLTYTKTTHRTIRDGSTVTRTTTSAEVPLTVPSSWATYTKATDRRIFGYARTLLKRVERLVAEDKATEANVDKALVSFIRKWEKLGNTDGASDTAVRECVGGFHDRVRRAALGEWHDHWDAWDRNWAAAMRRAS
jgi:hypothetical protein